MKWWGYVHINGRLQVKRYFDDRDIEDARESGFAMLILEPVEADNRAIAIQKLTNQYFDDLHKYMVC